MRRTSGASMFMTDGKPTGNTWFFLQNETQIGLVTLFATHCNCFQYIVPDLRYVGVNLQTIKLTLLNVI